MGSKKITNSKLSISLIGVFLFSLMGSPLLMAEPRPVTGPLDLTTVPLANATNTTVLPNLMFILDNSGSMARDYTPDYMSSSIVSPPSDRTHYNCRDSGDDDSGTVYPGILSGSSRILDLCVIGDPPFMNPDMNTQYYNPEIRYTPGVNSDGSSRGDQSDPTNVRTDSYNSQNNNQLLDGDTFVNLTTEYPDRLWCTINDPTSTERANSSICRLNGIDYGDGLGYNYPNSTFKYGRYSGYGTPNQTVTENMLDGLIRTSGAPYYYRIKTSEYCTSADLKTCVASSVPTGAYTFPANSRWCKDEDLTECQAVQDKINGYIYPRYLGAITLGTPATFAEGTVRINSAAKNATINSLFVGGVNIIANSASAGNNNNSTNRRNTLASSLATRINQRTGVSGYSASSSGGEVTITAEVGGAAGNGAISTPINTSGSISFGTINNLGGGTDAQAATPVTSPYEFERVEIIPAITSYPKAVGRTDCAGATCTYAEEITNFGNWYTYYRTRMQAMKSSASQAFKTIDTRYRVGFVTIASTSYLPIARFDPGTGNQKDTWYTRLFSIDPSGSTPLRESLAVVGRIFAGKLGGSDPIQYACQQNFALLTTDGYWNGNAGVRIDGTSIGNLDNDEDDRPKYEGATSSSGSLADVAKYYFDTDIRSGTFNNCDGAIEGIDVCGTPTEYPDQRMVTFTLGLGIDGTLLYSDDYKTALSGDFADIKAGVKNWTVPAADTATAIDDLWHAAVNGEGTYFSARNPAQLTQGLNDALTSIEARIGAGAAAATSTLNPVQNDNTAYVASYTSVKWIGNLEARSINIVTGAVNENAIACVENVIPTPCGSPSFVEEDTLDGDTIYNCVTPEVESAADCGGEYYPDDLQCKVQVQIACEGTMTGTKAGTVTPKVSLNSDTRSIKIKVGSDLEDFSLSSLTSAGLDANFSTVFLSNNLSQWSSLTVDQQANVTPENLIKYLRGQRFYEERSSNPIENRIFRLREAVLGDALESKPAFIGRPTFNYSDPGYLAFKSANENRPGTVYIGTNDGMLHAFDSETLVERWAYIPSVAIPNLWKLADKNYATNHANFVNGDPIISDICTANCTDPDNAVWKTILVAGLNGGGRGFYALDVTDPTTPALLWEFTPNSNPSIENSQNLGYSYGQPLITKLSDGTWVVLLTSGYNNIPDNNTFYSNSGIRNRQVPPLFNTGNGQGYLYILNAATGAQQASALGTGVGSVALPSGLSRISAYADDVEKNNTAQYVYGGDLLGNVWRFDINQPAVVGSNPFNLAKLYSDEAATLPQPITTKIELGLVNGKRVIFVGTGKYLQLNDLEDTQLQSMYAIKDDDAVSVLVNPRMTLTQQTFDDPTGDVRTMDSPQPVDFVGGRGWFVDLPDDGERQNIAGQLILGTLIFPTTVPSNTVCSPAGFSWLNFLDYKTGTAIESDVSRRTKAPIVGLNIIYIDGKPIVSAVTAADPTPRLVPGIDFASSPIGFQKKRVIWRELLPD